MIFKMFFLTFMLTLRQGDVDARVYPRHTKARVQLQHKTSQLSVILTGRASPEVT